jgi:hypothetical protein
MGSKSGLIRAPIATPLGSYGRGEGCLPFTNGTVKRPLLFANGTAEERFAVSEVNGRAATVVREWSRGHCCSQMVKGPLLFASGTVERRFCCQRIERSELGWIALRHVFFDD